jgi:hypothetical protein
MSPQLAFRKTTPDGLSIDLEEYEDMKLLLLTKQSPSGDQRFAQVLGVAGGEVNTPTVVWYYEYQPLPKTTVFARVAKWLEMRGYTVGSFDQYGNFRSKAA